MLLTVSAAPCGTGIDPFAGSRAGDDGAQPLPRAACCTHVAGLCLRWLSLEPAASCLPLEMTDLKENC